MDEWLRKKVRFLAIALGMVTPVSQTQLVLASCVGESEAKAERSLWGGDLQG